MKNWILATRPKTLPAAVVPVWVGSVPVLLDPTGVFSWLIFASTLLACLCIQIATNLFNDAIDADKGADTAARLGPRRMTASGIISRKAVLRAAFGFCVLGAIAGVPLIMKHGWIPLGIGGISFLLAYCYTGGPFPLAYRGLGELFVIIFFGLVAVLGTYFMQTGEWMKHPGLIAAWQVGFYSSALIAINNLRDLDEDRRSGKKTLAVRFGKTFARWEIAFFCFAPLFLRFFYGSNEPWTLVAIFVSLIFASTITRQVFIREPGPFYNTLLAMAALQLLNFALWFTIWIWR